MSEKSNKIKTLRGSLSKYSNPKLHKKEKEAWAKTAKEKYGYTDKKISTNKVNFY